MCTLSDPLADLVPREDDIRSGAALTDPVTAPLGLKPVVLALDSDVGAHAVNCEGGREVLEGHQQVQVPLSLQGKSKMKRRKLMSVYSLYLNCPGAVDWFRDEPFLT